MGYASHEGVITYEENQDSGNLNYVKEDEECVTSEHMGYVIVYQDVEEECEEGNFIFNLAVPLMMSSKMWKQRWWIQCHMIQRVTRITPYTMATRATRSGTNSTMMGAISNLQYQ